MAASINSYAASTSNLGFSSFFPKIWGTGSFTKVIQSGASGYFNLVWYTDATVKGTGFQCTMTIIAADTM